jgi:exonuclease VII small subunit
VTNEEIVRQLEICFKELNDSLKKCKKGILHKSEVSEIIKDTINKVKRLLPEDSDQYRIFDKGINKISPWIRGYATDYVEGEDCKKVEQLLGILKEVLSYYVPNFISGTQLKTEFHFSKDEVVEAKLQVFEIMKKAEKNLIIIDPYAGQDTEALKYICTLKELKGDLQIQVLTEKESPMFIMLYNDLVKKYGDIEAKKIEKVLHDRYLIIDQSEIWHLGTSINGIGKGEFTMTELVDKEEKNKVINIFTSHWANAKSL